MPARLILVTGTGTGIGKTHFAEALLLAWGRLGARVVGLKPVESGLADPDDPSGDGARLDRAASFHVKHARYTFAESLSPHLAARRRGLTLEATMLTAPVAVARDAADGVVLELAGGLFSPLAPGIVNADIAAQLRADLLLLVAPDRLGVLHDVSATARACRAMSLPIDGIVLVAPERPDPSTGLNAPELPDLVGTPVLAQVPRAAPERLASSPELAAILSLVAR